MLHNQTRPGINPGEDPGSDHIIVIQRSKADQLSRIEHSILDPPNKLFTNKHFICSIQQTGPST